MLRFLKARGAQREPVGAIPPGQRVYAIGDVHGRHDLLQKLLAMIAEDDAARGSAETHTVLLGDLIDRGPESAQVVSLALERATASDRVHTLMGNHEEMMLRALDEADGDSAAMKLFYRNGGRATLVSYGITPEQCDELDYGELRDLARRLVPAAHVAFMAAMQPYLVFGDYLYVHAGIRPGVPLAEQRTPDLRWIREPFLGSTTAHGHIVVHGHTITEDVEIRPNRIGLDTGAFRSGVLTAFGAEGGERWFLATADNGSPTV